MVCSPKSVLACVPRCRLAGERSLRSRFRLTGLIVALAINSIAAPVRAAGPTDPVASPPLPPPTFPRQGLALENPGRGERSSIFLDPVAARVVAATWTMPAKDEMVTFRNGEVRRWQAVQATPQGTFDLAGRGSYLAVEIGSEDERILILEASGHAQVYLNGEPRAVIPIPMVMSGCRSSFAKGRTRSCFRPVATIGSLPGCTHRQLPPC